MSEVSFSKWSPGGNTTVFLPVSAKDAASGPDSAAFLQSPEMLCAEQLGYADTEKRRLSMAGGEFCLNASRAFGALLDLVSPCPGRSYEMLVSGLARPLEVAVGGICPDYYCTARLILEDASVIRLDDGACLVHLPGISHLLVPCRDGRLPENHARVAAKLRRIHGLEERDACGVVWWQPGDTPRIWPLVHVRAAGTDYLENSCGSGSLALALALAAGKHASLEIGQPGGSALRCRVEPRGSFWQAGIGGPVRLVARGTVWIRKLR